MMKEIDFDNYVKAKLYDYKSPVPQGLWDKIVVETEIKKPMAFWWNNKQLYKLAAACVLLMVSAYVLLISTNKKDITAPTTKIEQQNKKTTYKQLITNPTTNSNTIDKNLTLKQAISNNLNFSGNNAQTRTPNTTNAIFKQTLKNNGTYNLVNNNPLPESNLATTPYLLQQNNSINIPYTDDGYAKSRFTKENTVSITNLFKFENKSLTSLQLIYKNNIFGLDCPNAAPSNWYLEVYGSPDYTTKKVYAFGVNDAYLQRIDSTTKMNGGFTMGLRISKSLNNNILLKSGLQYTQRNEQFTSKSDSIITTTSVVTVRTIVRGGGLSDTTVRDTSLLQLIGYRKRITNNHYKSIEIPLLLSYERGNDKWRVAINGGVIANLSSWYNGETLDTAYQLIPLSAQKSNGFYKSSLNLSLYAGVSIMRRVSAKIEAFAEPYFRYGLSNTNSSTIGYSQRFNAAGISFGIRYKLNGKGSKTIN